ncbi:MAG: hypothetical protein J6X70_11525 [Muribaculaceae bacterium]|nr:hypothetical protein [Muribaculaceae bacterium]
MAFFSFPSWARNNDDEPDFDYPQQVSKTALSDLKKALSANDPEATVDALVRFSIAKSRVTQESMDTIVTQIEQTINKTTRSDTRALLYHLEALVFESYKESYGVRGRENPEGEAPKDYTEWDVAQFDTKIQQLINQSMSDPQALSQYPITTYKKIIKYNDLGATYCPTLREFLCLRNIEIAKQTVGNAPLVQSLHKTWVDGVKGNAPAYLFATVEKGSILDIDEDEFEDDNDDDSPSEKLYKKFYDNEHCGMVLLKMGIYYHYNEYKDYLQRFPNSIYSADIANAIAEREKLNVSLSYDEYNHTGDSIKVNVTYENLKDFILDVYRLKDNIDISKSDYTDIPITDMKLITSVPVTTKGGTVPYRGYQTVNIPPLPYGRYMVIPRYKVNGKDYTLVNGRLNYRFTVTDLSAFSVATIDEGSRLVAIDLISGAPLEGVKFVGKKNSGVSDKDGIWHQEKLLDDGRSYWLERGDDKFGTYITADAVDNYSSHDTYSLKPFTDLKIYRPGETVHFTAIVYMTTVEKRTVVKGMKVRAVLNDANSQKIDTVEAVTDEYGRIQGEFHIPTDRLNGTFSVRYSGTDAAGKMSHLGYDHFEVSEYKTPTFLVKMDDDTRHSYTKDQPVKIGGKVMTYSGMPIANTKVTLELRRNSWSWSWRYGGSNEGSSINDTVVTTDANGHFAIEYPASLFEENKSRGFSYYSYIFNAMCTDEAGETHEESHRFVIGSRRNLDLKCSSKDYVKEEPVVLDLTLNSTDDRDIEKGVNVFYSITAYGDKDEKEVATGTFNSKKPELNLSHLPSGKYHITLHILGDEKPEKEYGSLILYSKSDKQSPVDDVMWIPSTGSRTDDRNVGHVLIGVGKPKAHIYYVATSRTKVLSHGWLHYDKGMHDFTIALPNEPEQNVSVRFYTNYNKRTTNETVHLTNNVKESLKVKAVSFRDLLVPGDKEHWQFQLVDEKGNPRRGAFVLEMMDKAINDLYANNWHFGVNFRSMSLSHLRTLSMYSTNSNNLSWSRERRYDDHSIEIPELNLYDESFFENYRMDYSRRMLGAAAGSSIRMKANGDYDDAMYAMVEESAESEPVIAYGKGLEDNSAVQEAGVDESRLENVEMRENDVKVALWHPMLTSDEKGNVSLEFDAPQYNTTWILQAIAYSKDLYTNTFKREVVTRKPLMVKANAPRFLRQGDKVKLAARVQNATDEAASADAVIEIFDPRSDKVYERKTYKVQLDSMGTQAVTLDWQVPDTVAFVGLRVKAANALFGDGEQIMVPVLEAISPVIETAPFYIDANTPSFTLQMPQFSDDARVTLEYCDNPTWYCITALPTLFDGNYEIATSLAHNLFAEVLAQGIAKSNPLIKEAIDHWTANNDKDSTLVSMLKRNGDLKIGTLLASPWVNEADRQTLRMESLSKLTDPVQMAAEHKRIVEGLQRLQMADGGFPWYRYPNCQSSLYTTETVLELIGELKHLGYLQDDKEIDAIVNKAIVYYDREYLKELAEHQKYHKNDYSGFSSYVYVRTLFKDKPLPKANANMIKNCLKAMTKDWKGTSLSNKAFYAITLNRNEYPKVAKDIIQSIREYALVKPELGMYWDSSQSGWRYYNKVAVTATVLEALAEVDPQEQELNNVRKWMLLMKQTNDWGSCSLASDAVYALLSTGSQWLERNPKPEITIDNVPVEFDKMEEFLGYARKQIPATSLATLQINRNGKSPAWGAIYSQYRASMDQIEAHAITDISVEKELYAYRPDGTLVPATSLKVGDKVQVRTLIKNNKDLSFVTLIDERGACFEPVDQVSGYRYADECWYYQETKDSVTNAFFSNLRKGTHVITYDVYVTNPGEFSVGIATAQCQYAPQITAHSAGKLVKVQE